QSITLDKGGSLAIIIRDDNNFEIWDASMWKQLIKYNGNGLYPHTTTLSNDGKYIFIKYGQGKIRVLDASTLMKMIDLDGEGFDLCNGLKYFAINNNDRITFHDKSNFGARYDFIPLDSSD